jgi:hypothetical protein
VVQNQKATIAFPFELQWMSTQKNEHPDLPQGVFLLLPLVHLIEYTHLTHLRRLRHQVPDSIAHTLLHNTHRISAHIQLSKPISQNPQSSRTIHSNMKTMAITLSL